jgi:PAS domain S-box-containing protein
VEGRVAFASQGAERTLDSLGRKASFEVLFPPDMADILVTLKRREPAALKREVITCDRIFEESIIVAPEHGAALIYARDVTEHRRAEQELRRQIELLEALIECPSDTIIFALDRKYRYTAFNAAHKKEMKKVYGVDISTGMNILDIINIPEVRAKAKRSIDHALSGESFYEVEVQPGLGIWYAFDWSPVRAPNGNVEGVTAFIQDITRRKQTEAALAGSELKYRSLFEGSNDAIMLLDSERFFDCNAATLKVFGYTTRDDFLGKHPADVSPPRQADGRESRVAADEKMAASLRAGHSFFEWVHQRGDGSVFPADVLLTPVEFGGRRILQATVRDVSGRKQAEVALSESEERFRRAFDDSRVSKLLTGLDGHLLRVNRAFAAMLGYSVQELQSGDFQAVTHPDDVALSVDVMKRLQTGTEGSARFEKRYLHRSGSVVWVELSTVLLRDSNGRPDHFVADVQDISDRKQAEAALSESEERYRRLVDEMGEGIGVDDADERFLFANPAADELFGVARGALVGRNLFEFLDAEQAELVRQQTAQRRIGRRDSYELEVTRPDQTKRTALVTVSPRHDAGGNFAGSFAIFRDISDRKQAELRDKQHLADTALLRDTAIGFIQLGRDADIYQYIADHLHRLVGQSYVVINSYDETTDRFTVRAVAGIGSRLETVLKVLGRNPVGSVFALAAEHRPEYASEKLLKIEDGVRGLSYGQLPTGLAKTIEKTFDLGGIYAMGMNWRGRILGTLNILMRRGTEVRDPGAVEAFINQAAIAIQHRCDADELVRHREHLQELVRERTAELEAANRELEAFSYSVSHDLRAPLRAIDGFAQAIVEDAGPPLSQPARGHLDRVSAAAGRMGELIDDLLDLARIARLPLERKEVDLSELAQNTAAELRRTAPDRSVEFVIPDGLTAPADPVLVAMVLQNLLGNAWKFTSKRPAARIEFGMARSSGERTFFVRDDGAGFDMAYVDKLFVPFQRLHSGHEFPGSGIGLAIVQRIVRRHGGRVWFEAEVNGGATCWFTLEPLSKEVERGRET